MHNNNLDALSIAAAPAKQDRVVIIGGGPAGIHMAHLLKSNGQRSVTVLEAESRLGGKSHTVEAGGFSNEMGACYLSLTYRRLMELLEELGRDDLVSISVQSRHVAVADKTIPVYLWMFQQLLESGISASNLISEAAALMERYRVACEEVRGGPQYNIPQGAAAASRELLAETFSGFLRNHSLDPLEVPFFLYNTTNCYGNAPHIPAYYGTYWFGAQVVGKMSEAVTATLDPHEREAGAAEPARNALMSMLSRGFESIWNELAAKSVDDVRLGATVTEVVRHDPHSANDAITVHYTRNGKRETVGCDFVIFAIPGKSAVGLLADPLPREREIFEQQIESKLVTTLVEATNPFAGSGIVYWTEDLAHKSTNGVYGIREASAMFGEPPRAGERSAFVAAQYYENSENYTATDCQSGLIDFLDANGFADPEIIDRHAWDYFPRFTAASIRDGAPWKLLEMQGEMRTWYIGSSACFESVEAVLEFNHFMVDKAAQVTAGG